MRFFVLLSFFCAVILGAGCATSRVVVENSRAPDIVIDSFGDVTFQGKRVAPEAVAAALASAKIPKTAKIRILVPHQRDHLLMRTVADNLTGAGYRPPIFATDKTATINLKNPAN